MYTLSEILRGKPKTIDDDIRVLRSLSNTGIDKTKWNISSLRWK